VEDQSLKDFEWIVIDGASSDGTIAELEECSIPNFSYVSERDRGLYDAMNKGLARSLGHYVIFMNSADCFAGPRVLELVRKKIEATDRKPAIVYGDALEKISGIKPVLKKARSIEWLNYGMHTHHQAMFYSRDALANLSYDESFKVAADYDLTCRVYRQGGSSLAINLPISLFSGGGLSEQKADVGRSENWCVQRDVLRHWLGRRLMTRVAYLGSGFLRKELCHVYDWLRFKRIDPKG
jgi:putative colanic acid biosynthesis glycosyltransferase